MFEDFFDNINEGFREFDIFAVAGKVEGNTQMNEAVKKVFDEEMKRIMQKMKEAGRLKVFVEMLEQNKDELKSPFGKATLKYATMVEEEE